ncbi:E3 ubiquitin-protein ligase UBR1 isoform X1 [Drosophila nasuta]|uniref:E3 ubiquitin-protein ligase UBR1 isoform X1 n=1 Tax=Drosophila nasuta TaxID=42062 RepID=UPI00295E336D|nr:E3 ubiquitin-protein ligase UBR1 isoform X1 [Drosophila nasuta]XP_060664255.1 E3 ubiquitin-protein ligase UBR1 isoform X1 [Drosophila nasuta]XP_060664256.1 E3 ubiquitin-protein ligase UBR1 isoform X1 [Drosophila nasuta]XP_060664257.1 E3 ubiquitin-protein ligase UBR1 isoform X1 [Drosophila nasuta]XP_060664259.1 E3 ubiquitin-protein ligase UBR1 isoform X1 [Drosophila nasuta]
MDRYDMDDVVVAPPPEHDDGSYPLKEWRLKHQAGTLTRNDLIDYFKKESPKYFEFQNETETDDSNAPTYSFMVSVQTLNFDEQVSTSSKASMLLQEIKRLQESKHAVTCGSLKCMFKESLAKEEIIDVMVEFMLGDNPATALEKLQLEGNTATVCGKVFKNGEPTYSCRECGVDPTCVLCVNCFKRSAHRFHKYKMSSSGGGGCCDCGDDEAWKRDQYCELHLANRKNPLESKIITNAVLERAEVCFSAILAFCVNYLQIEPNASLQCLDGELDGANFCTVLYNDESHTFDQVIQTLTKIAKCRHKDAMEIVAAIDREGRAVVKCDTFKECNDLKTAIENQMIPPSGMLTNPRHSQSLRTSVLNINSVACQQFALQLLSWFQEFLVRHYLFRKRFAQLVQQKNESFCIRLILEYDVKLWKTARTCWHRLLISGMLMEYENKMVLAQEFSRRYATIVQDFISDDHDHSFSIVSLSVQLFTVPSIAHHLIAQESILYKLLHTFYHVAIEKFIHNRRLHFSKNIASMAFFKRANYILYDLRYLLSLKPEVLSNKLRNGFIEGCKALMPVLNVMQGMESITRQMGQHMDYEPEWECAFNLHIKLASTISQVIEWAASDVTLLRKLYKKTVQALLSNNFIVGNEKVEPKTVAGHVADCLIYDVSTHPVSIHLPLSRFYAGIYLHLGAHDLTYDSLQAETEALNIKLTPREIIEPVLCTQAMIAQVAAGMWRRNGYSLLHQLYFYRNVRCRVEMLDRDIVCLQIGASLMESNEFLIHMLNKFNMIAWAQPNYEAELAQSTVDDEFMRQLSMTDEFLELLIVIIGERWMPGVSLVTEEDRLRKEIIQLLCIKSHSHSELSRALPDGNGGSNDSIIEDVINTVAVFKKPVGAESKGVYELKEHLYEDFNVYFYHYTKEDKSKAEELQRERRKNKNELVCCPPPMLPQLTPAFKSMANILQCNVFLSITTMIMDRALDAHSRSFTESHLQKVLHLLGFAIQEELSEYYPFLSFYERSQKYGVLEKLDELARCPRLEAHRDFVLWTIRRFKELQAKQAPNVSASTSSAASTSAGTSVETAQSDYQPLTSEQQARLEKEARSRLAAERRAKIMAQMQNAQKSFMKSNAEMFASTATEEGAAGAAGVATTSKPATESVMDWDDIPELGAAALIPEPAKTVACLGERRCASEIGEKWFKCILCFEDCCVSSSGSPLVSSAFLQTSRVIYSAPSVGGLKSALHVSCCGHVMHYNCWKEYYSSEETKELRRPQRNRVSLTQAQNVEFHCPYCRTLSNTVLPVSEALAKFSSPLMPAASTGAGAGASSENVLPLDCYVELMRTLASELAYIEHIWPATAAGTAAATTTTAASTSAASPSSALSPSSAAAAVGASPSLASSSSATSSSSPWSPWSPSSSRSSKMVSDDEWLNNIYPRSADILRRSNIIGDLMQFERSAQVVDKPLMHPNWIEMMGSFHKAMRNATQSQLQGQASKDSSSIAADIELDTVSLLWNTCSYTLQALEVYLYAIQKPLKAELPMRHQSCASNLVRACALYSSTLTVPQLRSQSQQGAKLLDTIFNQKGPSVLEWDCFRMLVQLNFMVPNLLVCASKAIVASGSMFDFYTLQTCFLANLTKAVICFDYDKEMAKHNDADVEDLLQQSTSTAAPAITMLQYVEQLPAKIKHNLAIFYIKNNMAARVRQFERDGRQREEYEEMELEMSGEDGGATTSTSATTLAGDCTPKHLAMLLEYVKRQQSSFLRCACLFYRCMTDVDFPDTFPTDQPDRFDLMCQYLGLEPQLGVYFDMESVYATMMQSFASHPYIRTELFERSVSKRQGNAPSSSSASSSEKESIALVPCQRPLPHLVTLYEDYSDLINSVSDIFCPNNEREEMKTPTMCLICGTILCGHSYCCQPELGKTNVGACTHHAHDCGAEVGIFLRIRDCQVVYLGRGKGCFVQPPYLDEYGETDQGLRRGNPLRLCKAAYDRIFLQWLGHNLHEEIARLNENASVAVTQWHHM